MGCLNVTISAIGGGLRPRLTSVTDGIKATLSGFEGLRVALQYTPAMEVSLTGIGEALKVSFSEICTTPYLYGVVTSPHTASVTAYMSNGGAWRFGSSYKGLSTNNTNTNYTIIKNGNANFNFTSSSFTKSTFTTPNTVVLGGYRAASGSLTKNYQGRVYFFRITEDSTPIIDYYPCQRLSDGVEGFWDCVTQTFIEPL